MVIKSVLYLIIIIGITDASAIIYWSIICGICDFTRTESWKRMTTCQKIPLVFLGFLITLLFVSLARVAVFFLNGNPQYKTVCVCIIDYAAVCSLLLALKDFFDFIGTGREKEYGKDDKKAKVCEVFSGIFAVSAFIVPCFFVPFLSHSDGMTDALTLLTLVAVFVMHFLRTMTEALDAPKKSG